MKIRLYIDLTFYSAFVRLFLIQYLSSEKGLSENTILAYRDALKLLLKYCADYLKIKQEIVDIKLNDLRLDAASQIKLTGKGKKQRVCPLWQETIEAVNAYISVRKPKQQDDNHLFLNDRSESITRFGIRYIIKKYTDKAIKKQPSLEQKQVSPHTLRHTTAMHLLQAGNELNVVRLWLGHANLNAYVR
jgi:integrase/recombinase XerD